MENKKKYLGSLKLLLVPLFIMLLGLFSTVSAKTTLSDNEIAYIVENAFTYNPSNNSYNNLWFTNNYNQKSSAQFNLTNFKTAFKSSFNSNNTLNFRDDMQNFFGFWACYRDSSNTFVSLNFYYTNEINFGKFDTYNHLYFVFNNSSSPYQLSIKTIDDNKNYVRTPLKRITFNINYPGYTNYTYAGLSDSALNTNISKTDYTLTYNNWNISNFNTSIIQTIPGIITFSNTNSVYTNFDGTNFYNTPINKLLQTNYIAPQPEEPNNSGDTNTGTITDNNGDVTGSINLSGIQNGLDNINNSISEQGQAIIDNQTENTDRIIESQTNNTQEITDTLTQQPNMSEFSITSGDIYNSVGLTPITNPYTNLWTTLLDGFRNSLIGTNRIIYINFRDTTYTINLDNFTLNIPIDLKNFLTIISTVYIVIIICKWTKDIIDDISTASIDNVANKLTDDFVSNMF